MNDVGPTEQSSPAPAKMSKDERRAFILRIVGDSPDLLGYSYEGKLHEHLTERGYDRNPRTLQRDMREIGETILSQPHALDSRIKDAILLDSEIQRTVNKSDRAVEPLSRLVEARAKTLGYAQAAIEAQTPYSPQRNKYEERASKWLESK